MHPTFSHFLSLFTNSSYEALIYILLAGVAPRPNIGDEKLNFLKLLKTMIVGALWFRLGLLSIRILCFLKSDKNDEIVK